MVVGEANNGKEAVESFRVNRPDVTLMDLQNARYERHRRHPRDPL
jgi:DNA-binding NarL/FixJ family response regulator